MWNALKCVYQYLQGTKDLWLVLGHTEEDTFTGYCNADGNSTEGRNPISSYIYLLNGSAVSWSSKRQPIVTLSTTESEYMSLTHAAKEGLWLRSLFMEIFGKSPLAMPLPSDNQGAIALSKDDCYQTRTKHIDIRFHFICYVVNKGKVTLTYCPTDEMTADILTKALPSMKQKHFTTSMGLSRL